MKRDLVWLSDYPREAAVVRIVTPSGYKWVGELVGRFVGEPGLWRIRTVTRPDMVLAVLPGCKFTPLTPFSRALLAALMEQP